MEWETGRLFVRYLVYEGIMVWSGWMEACRDIVLGGCFGWLALHVRWLVKVGYLGF